MVLLVDLLCLSRVILIPDNASMAAGHWFAWDSISIKLIAGIATTTIAGS
jgi:hypothetical protein